MTSIISWIHAFRLRTLFLAVASVILGSGLALFAGSFVLHTFLLALLLAVTLQILANLANDLGDYTKGTDITGKREGPVRALQGGEITPKAMKRAVAINILISIGIGFLLIFTAPHVERGSATIILILVGGASILAALLYTIGRHAYGYRGWGDFFAFVFFGPVPVIGTYFLHTGSFNSIPLLPAIGMGLISSMILNVNNMRDIENDRLSDKQTIAVKLGLKGARLYHCTMTMATIFCFVAFNLLYLPATPWRYIYLLIFIKLFAILYAIYHCEGRDLDPYLKETSLTGLLLSLGFVLSIYL